MSKRVVNYKLFVEYQLRLRSSICDTGITKEQSSPTHNFPWWVKWRGKNNWNPSLSPRVKPPWMPSAFVRASSPMGTLVDNLLEVFQLDIQDAMTKKQHITRRGRTIPFPWEHLTHLPHLRGRKTSHKYGEGRHGLFFDNRDWIAIRPTRKERKGGSVRMCKRAHWVGKWCVGINIPCQIKKEFVIAISQTDQERRNAQENLVKRTSNLSLCC